jgi:hypothetical protein
MYETQQNATFKLLRSVIAKDSLFGFVKMNLNKIKLPIYKEENMRLIRGRLIISA